MGGQKLNRKRKSKRIKETKIKVAKELEKAVKKASKSRKVIMDKVQKKKPPSIISK